MINWSELVPSSLSEVGGFGVKQLGSDPKGRNQSPQVGTGFDKQANDLKGKSVAGSDVPTVPADFERRRGETRGNNNQTSLTESAGCGVESSFAPHKEAVKSSCKTCAHLYRPGLSDGLCGGRDDLPPAYGPGHPLRQRPADSGVNCHAWELHPGF
jgi:hypothetical protein